MSLSIPFKKRTASRLKFFAICVDKASWLEGKFCNFSTEGWLAHPWMDVMKGMYSFNPRMRNLRNPASMVFSFASNSEISAWILLTHKNYSEIDIHPCISIANSFSNNCNLAVFFLENSLSKCLPDFFWWTGITEVFNELFTYWSPQSKESFSTLDLPFPLRFSIFWSICSNATSAPATSSHRSLPWR